MCNQYHTDYLMLGEYYQFEDFQMKWAFERLQRYQKRFCMFNDDMQVNTWCCILLFSMAKYFKIVKGDSIIMTFLSLVIMLYRELLVLH